MAAPATPTLSGTAALRRTDWAFLSPADAAREVEPQHAVTWTIYLMTAAVLAAVVWSMVARVDMVARAEARVVPEGRVQQIASLEGGLLRELRVREGEAVAAGQVLATLDPTRVEAQQNESQARLRTLMAAVARLEGEAQGRAPTFPAELAKDAPALVQGELDQYHARQRTLHEALASNQRSAALVGRELAMARSMAARGLMSDVEVMRLQRQINDIELQSQERANRFRLDAATELTKARAELEAQRQQLVVRQDMLERTTLQSPVRGLVKNVRLTTVGGVVPAGQPVMEIVPIGGDGGALVEVRIKPDDIGVVKVGQRVEIRLAAYDSTQYGTLHGRVETIAPDAMGDAHKADDAAAAQASAYYRALVRADDASFVHRGRSLAVLPGMVGTADVRVGRRSVASFLLRPMMRAQDAFRER